MPSEPPHTVHASTLTPDLQTIRKQMRSLALVLFGLSAWLCVGLLQCSINPETPTTYTHPMGSLIQSCAALSLRALGVVSVALCWLIAHGGALLWARRVPRLSALDVLIYAVFLVCCAGILGFSFPTYEVLGAPYGGEVGRVVASWLALVAPSYGQVVLVLALGACVLVLMQGVGGARRRHAEEGGPQDARAAAPVQSTSPLVTAEVVARFVVLAPDARALSERGERVGLSGADEGLIALDGGGAAGGLAGPRFGDTGDARRSASRSPIADRQGPSLYTTQTPLRPSPSAPLSALQTPIPGPARDWRAEGAPLLMISSSTPTPAAVAPAAPAASPRADRGEVLRRVLGQLGLGVTQASLHEGEVSDLFIITLSAPFRDSLDGLNALNAALNKEVKGTFGRVEPNVCALPAAEGGRELWVTWPRREQRFVSGGEGLQHNRDQAKATERLSLYVGKLPNERRVQIPFGQISTLLVTAGSEADPYMGLSLLISALIYQTSEDELRFMVASPHALERERPSPLAGLSYLYTPVMSDDARIIESITWLAGEHRRRVNSFNVMSYTSFKAYRDSMKEPTRRVVWIAPHLNLLSAEARAHLLALVERLERSHHDVGLHVVLGARGALPAGAERLARLPHQLHLYAPAEEARALGAPLSEHLLPASHDMLLLLSGSPARIHGWQMSTKALESFLGALKDKKRPSYVVGAHERLVPQAQPAPSATASAAEASRRPHALS